MKKPRWLERLLKRRASERDFKLMLAANTKTLPTLLSFSELNAGRVITGDMPDPRGILGEDGEQMREANGRFLPGTRKPALYDSSAYRRQLELERGWAGQTEDSDAATDLAEKVKTMRIERQ